jgi:hypothetical protein
MRGSPVTTITELKGGLAAAIGSDFLTATNQLLFVEWDSGNLSALDLSPTASYQVLGGGYDNPEDVKATADGTHAYVTERSGTLRYVDLGSADASAATVVTAGLTAPQQMFLDEAAGVVYVVEYAASGRLLRVDLPSGTQTVLLTGLSNAVGLTLSADRQHAYISEQLTGGTTGRVSSFQLSTGIRQTLASGLASPFMLTWADQGQTTLYVLQRDPANLLASIVVATATANPVTGGLPFRPSSAAVISPGNLLVCCDSEIVEVALAPVFGPDDLLLPAIGFIPVDWITPGGLADTSADPAYFYQVTNVPFGGFLPVMVNYLRAAADGAAYYRVLVDGVARTDQFHGAVISGNVTVPATITPQAGGYYPVLASTDLETWIPDPPPGCYLDSTSLTSAATHAIAVQLVNGSFEVIGSSPVVTVYVDNNPCRASLSVTPDAAPACGFIPYTSTAEDVSFAIAPSQPEGFATYSFTVIRGIGAPVVSQSGPVGAVASPITETVAQLLGECSVAGLAADLYVAASANSGWGRQGQYDAQALAGLALAPAPPLRPIPIPVPIRIP